MVGWGHDTSGKVRRHTPKRCQCDAVFASAGRNPSPPCSRRHTRTRPEAARKSAWPCAAAWPARSGPPPGSPRSPASAAPASASPAASSAGIPAAPKTDTSWRSYPGLARTPPPLPAGYDPQAARTGEPPHIPPPETPPSVPSETRKGQPLKWPAFTPPRSRTTPPLRGRLFHRRVSTGTEVSAEMGT
jgi:hypothetical protein